MAAVRLIALALAFTLTGPPTASLLCDWMCAAKHQRAPEAAGGCHDSGTPVSAPTVAAGHECHELATPNASILTSVPHLAFVMVGAVDVTRASALARSSASRFVRPSGTSHAPPAPLVPLRV